MHPLVSPFCAFTYSDSPSTDDEDYYFTNTTLIRLAARKNSQKPLDEFYTAFKLAHPDVGPGTVAVTSAAATQSTISTTGALSDPIMDQRCDINFFLAL